MSSRLTRVATTLLATATIGSVAMIAPATAAAAPPLGQAAASGAQTAAHVTTQATARKHRKHRKHRAHRKHRRTTHKRTARVSRSMTGVRSSAYRGRFYDSRYERTRKCIVRKESGGNYRIASRSGTYKGAYQFNSYLSRYAARRMGRPALANKPMNTWSRYNQDRAFWTVWDHGRGASNWPTRYGC